jgi:hypothetical protein
MSHRQTLKCLIMSYVGYSINALLQFCLLCLPVNNVIRLKRLNF